MGKTKLNKTYTLVYSLFRLFLSHFSQESNPKNGSHKTNLQYTENYKPKIQTLNGGQMNNFNDFGNLHFEDQSSSPTRRIIFIGSVMGGFTLLWILVSHNTVFWLVLLSLAILGWVASFGWRQALATLHEFIHRLEQN